MAAGSAAPSVRRRAWRHLSEIGLSGVIALMGHFQVASSEVLGDPEAWLSQNVAVVCHIARRVAERQGLHPKASEALAAGLLARLVEDDHRVLRRYRDTAGITTYLAVVATRLLFAQRTAATGPRRPLDLVPDRV